MDALRQRLENWLDASIGNRFGAVLLSVVLGFLVLAGTGNFAYLLHLTRQTASAALAEANRDAANGLEHTLGAIQDDVRLLAHNPTVASAVLDARDQETYLHPLLSRYRPQGRTASELCVTDYRGRPLGCASQSLHSSMHEAWVRQAIDSDTPLAQVSLAAANRPMLHIVHPINYEGTGSAEGAVVAVYDLANLVLRAVGSERQYDHVHLAGAGGDLYFTGEREGITHAGRDLDLDEIFSPLQLRLSLGVSNAAFDAPVLKLMAAYGLLAVLLVAAALWSVRRAVPPLIARLSAITAEANRVAAGKKMEFDACTAGADEIGQLARSFATMTARLDANNRFLESLVEARTAELRGQQALLHSIMDAVPGVIFQFRLWPDGRSALPFVSHALRELYGLDPDEVAGRAEMCFARVHPDDIAAHMESIQASARSLSYWQQDFRVVRPDGSLAWLHGNAKPQLQADGSVMWHGIITDITEQKRAENALADSEAYTKALFENSYIPLVIMDPEAGSFIDCNEAAVSLYRAGSRDEVVGKSVLEVSAPLQYDGTPSAQAALSRIWRARSEGLHTFEWRHQRPDGEIWDAEVGLMSFRHRGRELLQFSLRDITDQKRSDAEIWRRANFDALTGLANRSLCLDRIERAIAQARRSGHKVGILFVDLDGFKGINDSLGHAVGDELLIQVARRLEGCIREQDTTARFGGDEFVLVVQDLSSREDLRRVAEEALARMHQPFVFAAESRSISGSIGIAVFPDDAGAGETLLGLADEALYRSKRAGKNRYCFFDEKDGAAGAGGAASTSPKAMAAG